MAVILLVALALGLDLPFHREGEIGLSKFRRIVCADVVEAVVQLARQPGRIGGLPLDIDFPRRCFRRKVRERDRCCVFVHPIVHQAPSQEMALHPVDHLFIEALGHQEGHAKFREETLQRSLPRLLGGLHLHDFPGKRHIPLRHHEVGAELLSDGNKMLRDIAVTLGEGGELCFVGSNLLYDVSLVAIGFEFLLIQRIEVLAQSFRKGRQFSAGRQEFLQCLWQRNSQSFRIDAILLGFLGHPGQVLFVNLQFFFRRIQAAAAIFPAFLPLGINLLLQMLRLRGEGQETALHILLPAIAGFQFLL